MVPRLPIALAQVTAGNDSDKFFIICINKKITKKVYNNVIKSIQL